MDYIKNRFNQLLAENNNDDSVYLLLNNLSNLFENHYDKKLPTPSILKNYTKGLSILWLSNDYFMCLYISYNKENHFFHHKNKKVDNDSRLKITRIESETIEFVNKALKEYEKS